MEREIGQMMGMIGPIISAVLTPLVPVLFVAFAYFILTLDRQRANSPSKDDTQVGIKIVLYALILAGIGLAAGGVEKLLGAILSAFKSMPAGAAIKLSLPSILVGAGVTAAVALAFLPRTNSTTYRQAERYALGILGIQHGISLIMGLNGVLTGLFAGAPWGFTAPAVATVLVSGAVGMLAISRLGAQSGWTTPVRAAPPNYPPQGGQGGGGYPPQQGGYGQQQGGYGQQQGGGYPPQGGGYPPQGGGYPPQGGGYPPQA